MYLSQSSVNSTCFSKPLKTLLACALLSVLTLSGCSKDSRDKAMESANENFGLDEEDVFSLKAGTCFDNPRESAIENGADDYDSISSIPIRECSEPHDNEAYYSFDLEGGETFVDIESEVIGKLISEKCTAEFENYVGTSFDESDYYWSIYSPSEESWVAGDREILCYIFDDSGNKINETLKGSKK